MRRTTCWSQRGFACVVVALACSPLLMAEGQAPSAPLVFTHVNVVDVISGSLQRNFYVTIREGRIAAVVVRGRYLDRGELHGMLAAVEKTANPQ